MTDTRKTRIRQGRANLVIEQFDAHLGHWIHLSDILPGDTRLKDIR